MRRAQGGLEVIVLAVILLGGTVFAVNEISVSTASVSKDKARQSLENLADAIDHFAGLFDEEPGKENIKEQQVDVAMFNVGGSRVELLQGTTMDSTISKFVDKYGEGIHHICFEVDDLEESKARLIAKGFRFVDLPSSRGAHGTRVAFIHPKSAAGVLIELVEYPANNSSESS